MNEIITNQQIIKELLQEGEELLLLSDPLPFNANNLKDLKDVPGVYVISSEGKIIYVGQTKKLRDRLYKHHLKRTPTSSLRKNILRVLGTEYCVNNYLKYCTFQYIPINLGRIELEEYLIAKYRPIFNILMYNR